MARFPADAGDTIYALSSAPGRGALAVIRISGAGAFAALRRLCPEAAATEPRKARRVWLREGGDGDGDGDGDGEPLDEAMATCFRAPYSATGEDVVELSVHGGAAVVDGVLSALGRIEGLRQAEAGEFSWRSFLHGKRDLAQLEGLADLMAAESRAQRRLALSHLGGGLSAALAPLQESLTRLRGVLEAGLEFPDDVGGADYAALRSELSALGATLDDLLRGARLGARIRAGVEVVFLGMRNVGKSSLFNALLGREASIVSPVSGTTRDLVEAAAEFSGMAMTCVDTAGLDESGGGAGDGDGGVIADHGTIEREGMRRARAAARRAAETGGVLVLVLDVGRLLSGEGAAAEREVLSGLLASAGLDGGDGDGEAGRVVVALNKSDLAEGLESAAVVEMARGCLGVLGEYPCYAVSARTGSGLGEFAAGLSGAMEAGRGDGVLVARRRQRDELGLARRAVSAAEELLGSGDGELAAEELRTAGLALSRIFGGGDVESVLDSLFSEFCIGK